MGEFQADQLIALGMGDPLRLGLHAAGRLGTRRRGGCGSAGDFEQDLRGEPQGATHGNQGSPGGDIPGGGEFQKLLAFQIPAADKNRNR